MPLRRDIRIITVTAALVAAVLWCAPYAQAHGESSPFIRAMVDRLEPPAPGLSITTSQATATLLQVRNDTPRELEVLSDRGEPFIRIGRQGVLANVSSREWFASGNPDGLIAPQARTGGPPRWVRVSADPGWSWFEHRLHPRALTAVPPPTERRTVRLFDWTVPLRIGGQPAAIEGRVEWRPVLGRVAATLSNRPDPSAGVRVAMTPGPVPGMFLANTGRRAVTVRGRQGEPFLRFTRDRGTEANLRSPSYADGQRLRGGGLEEPTDSRARPLWRQIEDAPQHGWLETRARYGPEQPPEDVARRSQPTVLTTWKVPLDIGSERFDLKGTTTWVPFRPLGAPADDEGGGLLDLLLIVLAIVGVGALALLALRARGGRASRGFTAQ